MRVYTVWQRIGFLPRSASRFLRWSLYSAVGLTRPREERIPTVPWRTAAATGQAVVTTTWPAGQCQVARPTIYSADGEVPASIMRVPETVAIPGGAITRVDGVFALRQRTYVARDDRAVLRQTNQASNMPTIASGLEVSPPALSSRVTRLREPAFLVDCWHHDWGNLLMELVPQLALARHHPKAKIVTSAPLGRSLLTLLDALGIDRKRIVRVDGPVLCDEAYVPDLPLQLHRHIHPVARECFDELRGIGRKPAKDMPRIFVSRAKVGRRRLTNEPEIESIFVRLGFAVVHPETLSIEEQIGVFANAQMVAGLVGTAMHNAIFSKPRTPVLILAPDTHAPPIDVMINPAPGQLGYVFGRTTTEMRKKGNSPWVIDAQAVADAAAAHFGLQPVRLAAE